MPSGIYKHKSNQLFQKGHKVFGGFKKGNTNGFQKGKPAWNKGLNISGMSGKKQSLKQKQSVGGSNNWNWKGGIYQSKEYQSWIHNKRNRMKRIVIGSHTFGEWELLKKQYNFTCPACNKNEPEIKLTEDHIIPLSKGGSDNIENIQPLCLNCNCKKHTKIIKYDY